MKKISIKKIIATSVISLFFMQAFYVLVAEPEIVVAANTTSVVVNLGVTSGLSLSNGADVVMLPALGIGQNKAVGGSSWVATTNNYLGYTLSVKASTSPALKGTAPNTDSFLDYTEAIAGTPDVWGGVASTTKEFGYSANGLNTPTATWGTTSTGCGNTGNGAVDIASKYRGLTTGDIQIASLGAMTTPSGVTTNICFAAEQNNVYAASGAFTATITATMVTP